MEFIFCGLLFFVFFNRFLGSAAKYYCFHDGGYWQLGSRLWALRLVRENCLHGLELVSMGPSHEILRKQGSLVRGLMQGLLACVCGVKNAWWLKWRILCLLPETKTNCYSLLMCFSNSESLLHCVSWKHTILSLAFTSSSPCCSFMFPFCLLLSQSMAKI